MQLKYDYPNFPTAVAVLAHKSEHTFEDVIDAVTSMLSVIEHENERPRPTQIGQTGWRMVTGARQSPSRSCSRRSITSSSRNEPKLSGPTSRRVFPPEIVYRRSMRQTQKRREKNERNYDKARRVPLRTAELRSQRSSSRFTPPTAGARKEKLQTWHYHDLQLTTYGDRQGRCRLRTIPPRSGDDIVVIDFGDDRSRFNRPGAAWDLIRKETRMKPGLYHHHATPMAFVVVDQEGSKFLVMSIVTGWHKYATHSAGTKGRYVPSALEIGITLARAAGVPKELTAAAQAEGEAE